MKFNKKTVVHTVQNRAGGQAYPESSELEIVSLLLTSFLSDKFYESGSEQLERLKALVAGAKDKRFVAQAAMFARTEFGMRSITHAVAAQIGKIVKGEQWTKDFFTKVVHRADDVTEILSAYLAENAKPIPNSMKKGLAKALQSFDEYQLAKYRSEGKGLKMVDVVNLIHPQPTEAINKLVKGELKSKDTWESKLSEAGKAETVEEVEGAKKEAWGELIATRKLGYFALLRNLRNIMEQAPEHLDAALAMLVDASLIKKSLVMPFRFVTAAKIVREIKSPHTTKVLMAISDALDKSCDNVPKLEGRTMIALDCSGSMGGDPWDKGSLFAALLLKSNPDALLKIFSSDAKIVNIDPRTPTMQMGNILQTAFGGGGTNFHAIFNNEMMKFDNIIILSDMQCWMQPERNSFYGSNDTGNPKKSLADYKQRTGANPRIYSFDLQGYGTLAFPEKNVFALAGFSEKVFDLMKLLEEDPQAMVNKIKSIVI